MLNFRRIYNWLYYRPVLRNGSIWEVVFFYVNFAPNCLRIISRQLLIGLTHVDGAVCLMTGYRPCKVNISLAWTQKIGNESISRVFFVLARSSGSIGITFCCPFNAELRQLLHMKFLVYEMQGPQLESAIGLKKIIPQYQLLKLKSPSGTMPV